MIRQVCYGASLNINMDNASGRNHLRKVGKVSHETRLNPHLAKKAKAFLFRYFSKGFENMKFKSTLLFFLLWQTLEAVAAPIKVDVDRPMVSLNESFQITFSTTEDPDANPDFSPLEKDFEIIDRNHGSNSTWVNGVSSTTIQWTFDVMAKHAGQVTIPALRFGSETSPAVSITVTEGNKQQPDLADNKTEMFLEVEATPTKSYVQAQVLYTLRFYRRINIAEASLKDPEIADAVVTKLDEDKNYKRELKDVEYIVTERNYAIFPQKSGQITVPALTLTAAVLDSNDPSGFGGFFGARATRTERISSKPVMLTILPAPATFKGHWLAAEQLELKQQWSGDVLAMKVGEPLTRTLTLTAKGTTVGQLPQLQQATGSDDLKSYPDQPKTEEQKSSQGIVAVREEKIAIIPSKAGTYTLPPLEIPWFNVKTQQIETAKLPAVTVVATGVGKVAETNIPAPVDKTVENVVDKQAVINSPIAINANSSPENHYLWQGLAAFFALGWLVTGILLLRKKSGLVEPQNENLSPNLAETEEKTNIASLKKACASNDAAAAKQALIVWGKDKYNATTLGTLAEFCDARLSSEILNLNQILYGQQAREWDGKKLFQAFSEHRAMEKAKPKLDDKLEPLHRI
jgi:hypothetical protein